MASRAKQPSALTEAAASVALDKGRVHTRCIDMSEALAAEDLYYESGSFNTFEEFEAALARYVAQEHARLLSERVEAVKAQFPARPDESLTLAQLARQQGQKQVIAALDAVLKGGK